MSAAHTPERSSLASPAGAGLLLAALVLLVLGLLGVRQQFRYHAPTDQAQWRQTAQGLEAVAVAPGGAAARAGIRPGDRLLAVGGQVVTEAEQLSRRLYAAGAGRRLTYALLRQGRVVLAAPLLRALPSHTRRWLWEDLIGFLYLGIGIFLLFRRRSAAHVRLFYLFCLSSFSLYAFHFTGKLNSFDWTVFWINETALVLTPALFLHFALVFPRPKGVLARMPGLLALVYLPSAALLLVQAALARGVLVTAAPLPVLQPALDRLPYIWLAAAFLAALAAFFHTYRRAGKAPGNTVLRQQMKWVTRGATLGLLPFLALYVVPYAAGVDVPRWTGLSLISLVLIPLTFAYAIVRYRLMDADILFRRGLVYSLSAMAIIAVYFLVIAAAAALVHARAPDLGVAGWVLAIVVTALLFEPVKNWLRERLDRMFYRERYDYRRTLIEFARQVNAEPRLEPLLAQVADRLSATLSLGRLAVFCAGEPGGYELAVSRGIPAGAGAALGFLDPAAGFYRGGRIFIENPGHPAAIPEPFGPTVAALDLNYFVPCEIQGRVVAVLGLGKTTDGNLLSSEDVALVETLAGYLAVAIDHARLYAKLRRQAGEYERLKEFNENILEGVAIGIAAVDADDRVESWNAQMEVLSGRPRESVLGQPVARALGQTFAGEYYRRRSQSGGHAYRIRLALGPAGERTIHFALAPLVNRQGAVVGRILLIEDITAQWDLEQRLAQAERLGSVGLLAAGVAHEVNTPLAVIANYTQMLAKQLGPGDPRAGMVETITRQAFRASEIVSHLLHFSRTSGARLEPLALNQVISDTLALAEHPLRSSGVRVVSDLAADLPAVAGNAGRLQQVFLNLILNARDAMPSGGVLQMRTFAAGGAVCAEVADSGTGIPAEARHRVFDPFYTTKAPDRSGPVPSSGTGLGLSVTYGIVQEHGGIIQVTGEPGEGACFRLEFPALAADGAAVGADGAEPRRVHA